MEKNIVAKSISLPLANEFVKKEKDRNIQDSIETPSSESHFKSS